MKLFWITLAGTLAAIAIVLFLKGDYEKAFVSASVGSVAWFLSYRVQMRALVKANEPSDDIEEDELESDEQEEN